MRFSAHQPSRSMPSRPVTGYFGTLPGSNTLNPVASMSTSAGCSVPLSVSMPLEVTRAIGSVSSVTFARLNVPRYSL